MSYLDCIARKHGEEIMISFANHRLLKAALGVGLFLAGVGAGTWRARSVEAQSKFGQPKTVIHVVVQVEKYGFPR
jgi:hypothetical protein